MILAQLQRSLVIPKSAMDPNTSEARNIPVRIVMSSLRRRRQAKWLMCAQERVQW